MNTFDHRDGLNEDLRAALLVAGGKPHAQSAALADCAVPLLKRDPSSRTVRYVKTHLGCTLAGQDPNEPLTAPLPIGLLHGMGDLPALHVQDVRDLLIGSVPPALESIRWSATTPDVPMTSESLADLLTAGAGSLWMRPRWTSGRQDGTSFVSIPVPPSWLDVDKLTDVVTKARLPCTVHTKDGLHLRWETSRDADVKREIMRTTLKTQRRFRLAFRVGQRTQQRSLQQWIGAWLEWRQTTTSGGDEYRAELTKLRVLENAGLLAAMLKTKNPLAELSSRLMLDAFEESALKKTNLQMLLANTDLNELRGNIDRLRAGSNWKSAVHQAASMAGAL